MTIKIDKINDLYGCARVNESVSRCLSEKELSDVSGGVILLRNRTFRSSAVYTIQGRSAKPRIVWT